MKTNMQKYPTYKDSGVEWIGEIPEYWEILKGKWLFVKEERPARKEDGIVTCFRDGEVTLRTNRKTEGFTIALKEHGYQGIRKGDLVIHNMDAFAGAIGISDSDGKSTPVYSACTSRIPNKVNPYYYAYFLKNLAKSGFIESLAKGIRERSTDFRFNDFGLLLLSVPPLPEQTAIADFLDRKTALIDQAIGIKQKQIELLKERRQILIHKAVTRGLNPNAKMKDSGVEWIGEIPEHWTITLLKRFCHKITDGSHHSPQTQFEGRNYISVKDVDSDGNINLINCKKINEKDFKELVRNGSQPKINDILLTKDGTIGRAAIVDKNNDFVALSSLGIITPDLKLVLPQYLSLYLTSEINVSQMFSLIAGSALTRLTIEKINNLATIIPPLNEQFNIINYVKPLVNKIATAISLKEQEIERLKEYKATLINSAVTGKIKVC